MRNDCQFIVIRTELFKLSCGEPLVNFATAAPRYDLNVGLVRHICREIFVRNEYDS